MDATLTETGPRKPHETGDALGLANPYLDEYRRLMGVYNDPSHPGYEPNWLRRYELDRKLNDPRTWSRAGVIASLRKDAERLTARHELVKTYAWSVPTLPALERVRLLSSKVVSIGAGTGYWESLMERLGVEVLAYDRLPPDTSFHPPMLPNSWHGLQRCYTRVLQGGPEVLATLDPGWLLFLSWPPYDDPMAAECLDHYRGSKLVYVGENGGCTGDDRFHKLLESQWQETDTLDLPQWYGIHDYLMVYERRETTDGRR